MPIIATACRADTGQRIGHAHDYDALPSMQDVRSWFHMVGLHNYIDWSTVNGRDGLDIEIAIINVDDDGANATIIDYCDRTLTNNGSLR